MFEGLLDVIMENFLQFIVIVIAILGVSSMFIIIHITQHDYCYKNNAAYEQVNK